MINIIKAIFKALNQVNLSIMGNFQIERKRNLSNYKKAELTTEQGVWQNYLYDHILPINQQEKNIIANIRNDFWSFFKEHNIKLHKYFNHLNSSQALCFNLFFPLFHYDKSFLNYVLKNLMGIENGDIVNCEFEKILDSREFTNFDFFIEHLNKKRTLFEIKYTEDKFATTDGGKCRIIKYEKIYKPRLEGILKPEFINQDFTFSNYQIVRNLSYLDENTTVVFLFPKANLNLQYTEKFISNIVLPNYINQVKIIYLENITLQILNSKNLKKLHPIYKIFKHIYMD